MSIENIALVSIIVNVIQFAVWLATRSREELAKPPQVRNYNAIDPDDPRDTR